MLPVLAIDLKYYFKNSHELIYIYGFYFLILLIFPMGMRGELHVLPELAPSLLMVALIASIGIGALGIFQRDAEQGLLEQYQQMPVGLGGIILGKWLAFAIATVLPIATLAPVVLLLFGLPAFVWKGYMVGLLASGTALSLVASLAAAIGVGLERARPVVLLLILPLAVPVVIYGSFYLQQPAQLWQPALLFLIAFSIFLLPILCLAGASCIRASN